MRKWKCLFFVHRNFDSKGYSLIYKSILTVQLISLSFPVIPNQIYYLELNKITSFKFFFFFLMKKKANHFSQELNAFQANTSVIFSLGASLHFFIPTLGTHYHKVIRGIHEKLHLTAGEVL